MTIGELTTIANEYLNEDISIRELASRHGLSKTTLIRYFNGQQLIVLPSYLQEKVDDKKKQNWKEGKSTSGNLGHTLLTKEELQKMARLAVDNNLSLRELSKTTNINYSTLYESFTIENLGIDLYQELLSLYSENKKNKRK